MGGRRVSAASSQAHAPSLREGPEPGSVAGTAGSRPAIQPRQATAGTSSQQAAVSAPGARPDHLARSPEAPGHQPEGAPDLETPRHLLEKNEPDAAPGFTELPWLTVEQNEERRLLHGRLALWLERPEVSSERKAEVGEALRLVLRIERNMSRADELLHGMRTRLLTGDEWRELTYLVLRARSNLPLFRGSATGRLDRLVESNALSSAEARLLKGSLQRLVAAHDFLTSEPLPWRDIVKRVEVPLGPDERTAATVESRVVPGTAFGSYLASGYRWDENAQPLEKALSGHVPCLALTTLTNATGQLLFRGLPQGFIGLPELSAAVIKDLSDADLRRLIIDVVLAARS
ncbi:MAG: hypothetical protein OXE40_02535, partial [Gammaproteobacteria bacterium]|nr:hypothetical protein [Gammaproteobacteria bacterium]